MRRTALLCLPTALLLSSCGSEGAARDAVVEATTAPAQTTTGEAAPTAQATTTVENPLVADQALVRSLYYEFSQATLEGLQSYADFIVSNNHPDFTYSVDDCLTGFANMGFTDDFSVSFVPDVAAMAVDEGWALPSGRYEDLVPSGRVYIVPLEVSESDVGYSNQSTQQVHVSIIDARAYFFQPCNES